MNTITVQLGSYKIIATQQRDRKAWLVVEFSGASRINTYAVTTKKLAKNIYEILRNELNK